MHGLRVPPCDCRYRPEENVYSGEVLNERYRQPRTHSATILLLLDGNRYDAVITTGRVFIDCALIWYGGSVVFCLTSYPELL